jgi:hypothetical protein
VSAAIVPHLIMLAWVGWLSCSAQLRESGAGGEVLLLLYFLSYALAVAGVIGGGIAIGIARPRLSRNLSVLLLMATLAVSAPLWHLPLISACMVYSG